MPKQQLSSNSPALGVGQANGVIVRVGENRLQECLAFGHSMNVLDFAAYHAIDWMHSGVSLLARFTVGPMGTICK